MNNLQKGHLSSFVMYKNPLNNSWADQKLNKYLDSKSRLYGKQFMRDKKWKFWRTTEAHRCHVVSLVWLQQTTKKWSFYKSYTNIGTDFLYNIVNAIKFKRTGKQ